MSSVGVGALIYGSPARFTRTGRDGEASRVSSRASASVAVVTADLTDSSDPLDSSTRTEAQQLGIRCGRHTFWRKCVTIMYAGRTKLHTLRSRSSILLESARRWSGATSSTKRAAR